MESPGRYGDWLAPPPSPPRGSRSQSIRPARGKDFYLATSGDLYLATSRDIFMATDSPPRGAKIASKGASGRDERLAWQPPSSQVTRPFHTPPTSSDIQSVEAGSGQQGRNLLPRPLCAGDSQKRRRSRKPPASIPTGQLNVVGLAGLEPAASSLSEMDGRPLCYPAFPLVVRLRKSYRDGVNSRGCPGLRRTCGGGPRLMPAVW